MSLIIQIIITLSSTKICSAVFAIFPSFISFAASFIGPTTVLYPLLENKFNLSEPEQSLNMFILNNLINLIFDVYLVIK